MRKTLSDLTDKEYEIFLKNHALLTNQDVSQLRFGFAKFRKRKIHPAPIRKNHSKSWNMKKLEFHALPSEVVSLANKIVKEEITQTQFEYLIK